MANLEKKEPIKLHHETVSYYLDEWLDFPAHIHHMSYRMENPPVERPQSQKTFLDLAKHFNMTETNLFVSEKLGYGVRIASNGDRLILVWKAHTEYYSVQIWHIPGQKNLQLKHGPITFPGYQLPSGLVGGHFNALDIVIFGEGNPSTDEIKAMLPGYHTYGGRVFGEDIAVVTSFTSDVESRERYVIYSSTPEALSRHLPHIIDGVVTIETYYRLLMFPFPAFTKAVDHIHELERNLLKRGVTVSEEMNTADSKTIQAWLTQLTHDFMESSQFAEEMRFRLSASVPYGEILHATIRAQQERPLPPFLPLYDHVLGIVSGVSGGYQQLTRRIDTFVSDFQSTISVIRAKVNLMLQEQSLVLEDQNLRLLANVDKTTKSQAVLQHTVESLSVIVIAYYLSGLAAYIFKAFEKMGWIESATTASGVFVPVSILASLGLILVGRKIIHKYMDSAHH